MGSSPSAYIQRESARRDTTIYVIKTTPEQDKAAVDALFKEDEKGGIGVREDNCSTRSNAALDAAGIPKSTGNPPAIIPGPVPGQQLPTPFGVSPNIPGTAGVRAGQLPADKVTKISIPKGSSVVPDAVKQFEPKHPHPDPRLPKKENESPQQRKSS